MVSAELKGSLGDYSDTMEQASFHLGIRDSGLPGGWGCLSHILKDVQECNGKEIGQDF